MTAWLISQAWPYLLGLMALVSVWFGGRRSGKASADEAILKEYKSTRERMDDVKVGNDPAVLREWMRERGKQ